MQINEKKTRLSSYINKKININIKQFHKRHKLVNMMIFGILIYYSYL